MSYLSTPSSHLGPPSVSDTTEILDTDFDSDSLDDYSDESQFRSIRSVGVPPGVMTM